MVGLVITDLGVFDVVPGRGLVLRELIDPAATVADIRARTAAPFDVDLRDVPA
ncbi:hypothetical protein D3C83_145630 [compost metagenome]